MPPKRCNDNGAVPFALTGLFSAKREALPLLGSGEVRGRRDTLLYCVARMELFSIQNKLVSNPPEVMGG